MKSKIIFYTKIGNKKQPFLSSPFIICILLSLLLPALNFAQTKKYFFSFKDKTNTPYSISSPKKFLSSKAILRRIKQNISIKENDLPVTPAYIDSIVQNGGIVWFTSKWMNGALVEADSSTYQKLLLKSFIKNSILVSKVNNSSPSKEFIPPYILLSKNKSLSLENYGPSLSQNIMIGADEMHNLGFDGTGMTIGIFDVGFQNADILPVFDSLNLKNKIKGVFDFVDKDTEVYDAGTHGTMVLSCIGGYSKGNLIGTAFNADYYLFRTEDGGSEKRIEEFNWLFAAERADSIGVDIINTSLGYTQFDDTTMNYTYEDLDGNTAIITRATDLAASKGILCVNSAGNSGLGNWHFIGAPADADSVLAVGAVDAKEIKAGFSSFGPSSDGRVKPNLCAQGQDIIVSMPDGNFVRSNGTSFSAPILCGMTAGLWQAHPTLTNMEILDYLQRSGSNYPNSNDLCGFGIPNFVIAHNLINKKIINNETNDLVIYPNPIKLGQNNILKFKTAKSNTILQIELFDVKGRLIYSKPHNTKYKANINIKKIIQAKGIYFLKIITANSVFERKIVVN